MTFEITYENAFPQFDASTMPKIPKGFIDVSWPNDTCPSFYNKKLNISLIVDYADSQKHLREDVNAPRFSLIIGDITDAEAIHTDDYSEILELIAGVSTC